MLPTKDAPRPTAGSPGAASEPAGARGADHGRPATPGTGAGPVTASQRPAQGHGGHGQHGHHGGGGSQGRRDSSARETRSSGSPNIQDVFLNYARREKLTVVIQLLDGQSVEGRIKNFDRFALIIDHGGVDHLVFKHAIATIRSPRSIGSYYASHEAS
jgi:host factor-I protein